ncbi:hypothetical protein Tco_0683614 [Tanacetum coccineum]
MSLDEAIGRLKTFEERLKYKNERPVNTQEKLLFTRHEGQEKPSRERGRFNQSRGREQDKNNYQSKRKTSKSQRAEIAKGAEIAESAKIAENAEAVENAEDSRECRKILKNRSMYSELSESRTKTNKLVRRLQMP